MVKLLYIYCLYKLKGVVGGGTGKVSELENKANELRYDEIFKEVALRKIIWLD